MPNNLILFAILVALGIFIESIAGSPTPFGNIPSRPKPQTVMIGYNGFSGKIRPKVIPSKGGELGAVFYVTDSVDLARWYAKGADKKNNYICAIYAERDSWAAQRKVWVPEDDMKKGPGAIHSKYHGSVIFAEHLPVPGASGKVYQMGVWAPEIALLGITAKCLPRGEFDDDHATLNYPLWDNIWHIERPVVTSTIWDQWKKLRPAVGWNGY